MKENAAKTAQKNTKTAPAPAPKPIERNYSGKSEIDSDLFKLEVTSFRKNVSFDPRNPQYETIEHCHFYRTFDSSGRECITCNAVGGHEHKVTVEYNEEGQVLGAECGPAKGRTDDGHVHNIRYIKSDKVERRIINQDAAKYMANVARYN